MGAIKRQSGMSIPGILVILVMVGFFVMCAIRISPPYFEYLSVKKIIVNVVTDVDMREESPYNIRKSLTTNFNTNQIYELDPKSIEVYTKKGNTHINANYEVRIPIVWRIDAMLKFDDLVYTMGQAEPVLNQALVAK